MTLQRCCSDQESDSDSNAGRRRSGSISRCDCGVSHGVTLSGSVRSCLYLLSFGQAFSAFVIPHLSLVLLLPPVYLSSVPPPLCAGSSYSLVTVFQRSPRVCSVSFCKTLPVDPRSSLPAILNSFACSFPDLHLD